LGTFFLYNRGYAFWSQRLQEGAYYWVQFAGPYLVHSVPFDASGKLKQESKNWGSRSATVASA